MTDDLSIDPPKSGIYTSEFWVTLLAPLVPLVTFLIHRNIGPAVPEISALAAAVASAVYAVSRAVVKSNHLAAQAAAQNAQANVQIATLNADTERVRLAAEFPPIVDKPSRAAK